MKVEPYERDVFLVESEGSSGEDIEHYRVDLSPESFGCSCKDWHYRHARYYEMGDKNAACKHIKAARAYAGSSELTEADCIEEDGLAWFVICEDGTYRAAKGKLIAKDKAQIGKKVFDISDSAWLCGSEDQARDIIEALNQHE